MNKWRKVIKTYYNTQEESVALRQYYVNYPRRYLLHAALSRKKETRSVASKCYFEHGIERDRRWRSYDFVLLNTKWRKERKQYIRFHYNGKYHRLQASMYLLALYMKQRHPISVRPKAER